MIDGRSEFMVESASARIAGRVKSNVLMHAKSQIEKKGIG
jgi:hypothetical protein